MFDYLLLDGPLGGHVVTTPEVEPLGVIVDVGVLDTMDGGADAPGLAYLVEGEAGGAEPGRLRYHAGGTAGTVVPGMGAEVA